MVEPASADAPPVLGVVGLPHVVANSLSPTMFAAAFHELGITGYYVPLGVRERAVRKAIRSLPRLGFRGANVTMPYKAAAAEVADTRSDLVQLTGIANTLAIDDSGHIHAEATDGDAVTDAITSAGVDLQGASVVVLGAGGAAIEAAVACASAGAAQIHLWNRSRPRAEALANILQSAFPALTLQLYDVMPIHVAAHVLVSAVPGESFSPDALAGLYENLVVVDLAYRRDRQPTTLIDTARPQVRACIDGREILVRQGAAAFRIWFGVDAPIEVMFRAVA